MTIEDMKPPTAIPEAKFVACFQRGIFANVFSTLQGIEDLLYLLAYIASLPVLVRYLVSVLFRGSAISSVFLSNVAGVVVMAS